MGILSNILNSLTSDDTGSEAKPCTNCRSDCTVYPYACAECKEYKEKIAELIYDANDIDAFRARYEVVSGASVGTVACPYCGAPNSANAFECEYCGSALRESNGKIQVASAKDIPNPILEVQELIFKRREIVSNYSDSKSESTGLLSALAEAFTGSDGKESFGSKMSESEIKELAEEYGVSVGEYLQGLDNGKYLTKEAKEKEEKQSAFTSESSGLSSAAGLGAAGLGTAAILGNAFSALGQSHSRPEMPDVRPQSSHRPPMPPQGASPDFSPRPGQQRPQGFGMQSGRPGMNNRPQSSGRPGTSFRPDGNTQEAMNRPGNGRPGGMNGHGNSGGHGGSHGGPGNMGGSGGRGRR